MKIHKITLKDPSISTLQDRQDYVKVFSLRSTLIKADQRVNNYLENFGKERRCST